jgi:hypothetical protein
MEPIQECTGMWEMYCKERQKKVMKRLLINALWIYVEKKTNISS